MVLITPFWSAQFGLKCYNEDLTADTILVSKRTRIYFFFSGCCLRPKTVPALVLNCRLKARRFHGLTFKTELLRTKYNLKREGRRTFSVAAPLLWNSRTDDIRNCGSVCSLNRKVSLKQRILMI